MDFDAEGSELWRAQGKAAAKINLALQVKGLQPDGFHGIRTVMICLDLADRVEVTASWNTASPAPETTRVELELDSDDAQVPRDHNNLVVKAAHLLLARRVKQLADTAGRAVLPAGAEIPPNMLPGVAYAPPHRLRLGLGKAIPTEAGLGGGSADAAAMLRLLNKLPGMGLSSDVLFDVAAHLGSDVPFALLGGAALAEGRGERLTPLPTPNPLWVVLVQPHEIRINTGWCYRRWDELNPDAAALRDRARAQDRSLDSLVIALGKSDLQGIAENLFNDLQEPVLREYPQLAAIPQTLKLAGCAAAMMTGSGSCFFGLAATREKADNAEREIARGGLGRCWITQTVGPTR